MSVRLSPRALGLSPRALGLSAALIALTLDQAHKFWMLVVYDSRLTGLALGLVIGGALGNAVDRVMRGAVADFFYLHTSLPVGPLANYVFNVADVFITGGVALLLYESLFLPPPAQTKAETSSSRH